MMVAFALLAFVLAFVAGAVVERAPVARELARLDRERAHLRAALDALADHCWEAHPHDLERVAVAGLKGTAIPDLVSARYVDGRHRPRLPRTEAEAVAYVRALADDTHRAAYEKAWRSFRVVDLGAWRSSKR